MISLEAMIICVCGETSSYLADTLEQILPDNCQIELLPENVIFLNKYFCILLIYSKACIVNNSFQNL
jgi:hypothetical protein